MGANHILVPEYTLGQKVVTYYYDLPPHQREHLTWLLSKTTMQQLAQRELEDHECDSAVLMGRPVKRDDTIDGLHIEIDEPFIDINSSGLINPKIK